MALTLVSAPGYSSRFSEAKFMTLLLAPKLASILKLKIMPEQSTNFFINIIKDVMKQRRESGYRRNDMIDLILDEINRKVEVEGQEKAYEGDAAIDTSELGSLKAAGFDEETLLISNTLLFFIIGFDTNSLGMATVANKLALHPEYQEKVYEEIVEMVGDSEDVTFDHIAKMKYMDQFLMECFRHQQDSQPHHERKCTKDYR